MKSKVWPVPSCYSKKIPFDKESAFKAPRKYKNGMGQHTGIDIYTPIGSKIVAIEDGIVVHVGQFTGGTESPQWRTSWYVMVKHADDRVAAYCEVRKPCLKKGQKIRAGQIMGYAAKILFGKYAVGSSMLHFELHKKGSRVSEDWIGKRPARFLDPTEYLKSI